MVRKWRQQQQRWVSGVKNSLASALAAGCSKLLLAPFDTIKVIQQHSQSYAAANPLTLVQAALAILQRPWGVLELYVSYINIWIHIIIMPCHARNKKLIKFIYFALLSFVFCVFLYQAGIDVAMVGSMPSVGLYFGIYSFCKKTLSEMDPEYPRQQTVYIALPVLFLFGRAEIKSILFFSHISAHQWHPTSVVRRTVMNDPLMLACDEGSKQDPNAHYQEHVVISTWWCFRRFSLQKLCQYYIVRDFH